jgi:outer membrane protein OmpA-like peptidoglycan-associated protein
MVLMCQVVGCGPPPSDDPLEFRVAMVRLSADLMTQFRGKNSPLDKITSLAVGHSGTFIIDPFVDGDTGDVTQTSESIATILRGSIESPPNGYSVLLISNENMRHAQYVVVGSIKYERYRGQERKLYHIYASVVDIASGDIIANAAVWVANRKLEDTPIPMYKNSPMFLKDNIVQKQLDASQSPAGSGRARSYVRTLDSATVTQEGGAELAQGSYQVAIASFQRSLSQPDGHTMKNYAGLYEAYYRSQQKDLAIAAFADLFALGVENNNITVRFLFNVDSTAFFSNTDVTAQYDLWLRQISRYLGSHDLCMSIVGHSSHTGTAEYNLSLSLRRAQRIKETLTSYSSSAGLRLNAIGRGFEENIIGSGTDDDQDAIDRRVEFRARSCQVG